MTETIDRESETADQFWYLADKMQRRTLDHAETLFTFAETADPQQLFAILLQYRFFTIYYIPDLAILVARMQDGRLRSFFADILSDELGYGDPQQAHPRLYDDFLNSINTGGEDFDSLALKSNIVLLDTIRARLLDEKLDTAYAVGLRGMGGECVCQVYLARFYCHIIKNPYIQDLQDRVDWRFWDLHVGEHDVEHRLKTREIIHEEVLSRGPAARDALWQGYRESMLSWRSFWSNIFNSVRSSDFELARVRPAACFQAYTGNRIQQEIPGVGGL